MGGKKQRHIAGQGARHGSRQRKKERSHEKKPTETHSSTEIQKNTIDGNGTIASTEHFGGATHFSPEPVAYDSFLKGHVNTTVIPADTPDEIPLPLDQNKNAKSRISNTSCISKEKLLHDLSGITTRTTREQECFVVASDPSTYASTSAVWATAPVLTPDLPSEGTRGIESQEKAPPEAEGGPLSYSSIMSASVRSENPTPLETSLIQARQLSPAHAGESLDHSQLPWRRDEFGGCPPLQGATGIAEQLSLADDEPKRLTDFLGSKTRHGAFLLQKRHQREATEPADLLLEEQHCTPEPKAENTVEPESVTRKAEPANLLLEEQHCAPEPNAENTVEPESVTRKAEPANLLLEEQHCAPEPNAENTVEPLSVTRKAEPANLPLEEHHCAPKLNAENTSKLASAIRRVEPTDLGFASGVALHDRMEPLCSETAYASTDQNTTNGYAQNDTVTLPREPCTTPGATDKTRPEAPYLQEKSQDDVGKGEALNPLAEALQTPITEGTPVTGYDGYRLKGNQLLKEGNLDEAIAAYTVGLKINPRCHILLSNRSTAYMMKNDYASAVKDASACVAVNPKFAKGYSRKATALWKLGRLTEALSAAETGLALHAAADDPEANVRILRYTHQQIRTALLTHVLCGRWKGTVHPDLGGYEQIFEFDSGDSSQMRCIVMGRTMNARYIVRLAQHPHTHRLAEMDIVAQPSVLGDPFIPPPTVPYVFRLMCRCPDSDGELDFETVLRNPATLHYIDLPLSSCTSETVTATNSYQWDLQMCAPYLSIDRPTELSGPGLVVMKKENPYASTACHGQECTLALSLTQQVKHYLTALGEIYPANGKYVEEPDMDDDQIVAARKVAQLISEQSKLYSLSQRYLEPARSAVHHLLLQQEPFSSDWPAPSCLAAFGSFENDPVRQRVNRDLFEELKAPTPTTVGAPDTTVDPDAALPELKVLAQHTAQHLRTTGLDVILFAVLQPHLPSGDAEREAQPVPSAPFLHPLAREDAGAPPATVDSPAAFSPSGEALSPASTSVAAFASATHIPGALSTMASLQQPSNSSTDTTPMTGVDAPLEHQSPVTSNDLRTTLNSEVPSDACCHRAHAVWKWMQKNKVAVSVTATVIAVATTAAWVFYSRGAQRTGKPNTNADPPTTNPFKRALSTDLRSRS